MLYILVMKNLIESAYRKLNEIVKTSTPSWETYARIADLVASIQYLQEKKEVTSSELSAVISDMRSSFGDEKTLDLITKTLTDFKKDLDCVSPQLFTFLIKKLKESF